MSVDDGLPPDQSRARKELMARPSRARYDKTHANLQKKWRRRELRAERMMREIVDELWEQFEGAPYSWCGFYLLSPDGSRLILGPHRDKPACSPLPLHGVCGRALKEGKSILVDDVKALADRHIECDPRNQSEIALPVYDKDGKIWAVFDVDSAEKAAFDEMHERWLERILKEFQCLARPNAG
jgi:putative methionine-R-sulfoxide reductase with GAF domain